MTRAIFVLLVGLSASKAWALDYSGEFSGAHSSGEPCETLFTPAAHSARFIVTGQTAVLHFEGIEEKGFFHGTTFVGQWGYANDFEMSKTLEREGIRYRVQLSGIATWELLYAEAEVTASRDGKVLCTAAADYTGVR